jgi:hypothetical protein
LHNSVWTCGSRGIFNTEMAKNIDKQTDKKTVGG